MQKIAFQKDQHIGWMQQRKENMKRLKNVFIANRMGTAI